jgi:hypothetical protein
MEKEVIMKILSLYSLLFLSLLVAPAFAKPTAVTLYPRGATIFEQTTIPAGAEAVSLQLPNVAIQKSLKLKLIEASGQRIGGIEFESILPDTSAFQELQNRIDQLEKEIANVTDQLESNKRTLDYWKNQQDLPIKTLADVRAMGKIIHDESITLLQNSTQLDRQKKDLEQQRDEARNTLQQKTGKNQRRWKVTIRLTAPASDNIDMVYSTSLPDEPCSCTPYQYCLKRVRSA